MAGDRREIVTDLLARNRMGPATRQAADDLERVGDAAEAAGEQAEDFGKSTEAAGEGAEKLGKESSEAARHVEKLNDEIEEAEKELVKLAAAFAAAGDAGERLDVSKAIRRTQNDLRRLTSNRDILQNSIPDMPDVGKGFLKSITSALPQVASRVAAAGPQVGVALGVAMAPALVGALGAAVTGGIGIAGIGAGIALAMKGDPKLKEAGSIAGKRFMDGMQSAAAAGLGKPIMNSIELLSNAGDRITAKWKSTFSILGDSVIPLTKDVITGVERINEAITNVASKSGPAIAAIGDSFVLLAEGASDFLESLSTSKSANDSLVVLAGIIGGLLTVVGKLVGWIGKLLEYDYSMLTGPLKLLSYLFREQADGAEKAAGATEEHANAMSHAELAARGNADGLKEVNNALRAQADPVFALRESQIKLAEAQTKSTEAIEKHGARSKEAKEATRNLAKAALDLQGNVAALGKDFDGRLTPAMHSSLRAAGLTEKQIAGVESEFRSAKKAGDSYAKTYSATTKVYGAETARRSLFSVKEVADGIPRAVSIGIRITGVQNVSKAKAAIDKNYARARGGPVAAGQPYWVGEEGPELLFPDAPGTVVNASASRRMAAGLSTGYTMGGRSIAAGGSGGTARVMFDVTGAEGKFKSWLREWVRTEGILT